MLDPKTRILVALLVATAAKVSQDISCQPAQKVDGAGKTIFSGTSLLQMSHNTISKRAASTSSTALHDHDRNGHSGKASAGHPIPPPALLTSQQSHRLFVSKADNLCMQDSEGVEHLVPEFLLLGTEKAATTTFYGMFIKHTAIVAPEGNVSGSYPKEMHAFDNQFFDRGLNVWLHRLPQCSHSEKQVTYDCSPTYLRDPKVPTRLKQFYGELSARVMFAAILRNPIDRMHSAFHYYRNSPWHSKQCPQTHSASFKAYVQGVIAGRDPCMFLQTGDYATQLRSFFAAFNPSQFTISLFKAVVDPSESYPEIRDVWRRLGLHGVEQTPLMMEHANSGSHRKLWEDLDNATMLALQQHVDTTLPVEALAQVLLSPQAAALAGPILVGYKGKYDQASVTDWIKKSW